MLFLLVCVSRPANLHICAAFNPSPKYYTHHRPTRQRTQEIAARGTKVQENCRAEVRSARLECSKEENVGKLGQVDSAVSSPFAVHAQIKGWAGRGGLLPLPRVTAPGRPPAAKGAWRAATRGRTAAGSAPQTPPSSAAQPAAQRWRQRVGWPRCLGSALPQARQRAHRPSQVALCPLPPLPHAPAASSGPTQPATPARPASSEGPGSRLQQATEGTARMQRACSAGGKERYGRKGRDGDGGRGRTSSKNTPAIWRYSGLLNAKSTSKMSQQVCGEGPGRNSHLRAARRAEHAPGMSCSQLAARAAALRPCPRLANSQLAEARTLCMPAGQPSLALSTCQQRQHKFWLVECRRACCGLQAGRQAGLTC